MERRRLSQLDVSAIGLGCATMTPFYGEPDPIEAVAMGRRRLPNLPAITLFAPTSRAASSTPSASSGIGFVAYSPLWRGFLTGTITGRLSH